MCFGLWRLVMWCFLWFGCWWLNSALVWALTWPQGSSFYACCASPWSHSPWGLETRALLQQAGCISACSIPGHQHFTWGPEQGNLPWPHNTICGATRLSAPTLLSYLCGTSPRLYNIIYPPVQKNFVILAVGRYGRISSCISLQESHFTSLGLSDFP